MIRIRTVDMRIRLPVKAAERVRIASDAAARVRQSFASVTGVARLSERIPARPPLTSRLFGRGLGADRSTAYEHFRLGGDERVGVRVARYAPRDYSVYDQAYLFAGRAGGRDRVAQWKVDLWRGVFSGDRNDQRVYIDQSPLEREGVDRLNFLSEQHGEAVEDALWRFFGQGHQQLKGIIGSEDISSFLNHINDNVLSLRLGSDVVRLQEVLIQRNGLYFVIYKNGVALDSAPSGQDIKLDPDASYEIYIFNTGSGEEVEITFKNTRTNQQVYTNQTLLYGTPLRPTPYSAWYTDNFIYFAGSNEEHLPALVHEGMHGVLRTHMGVESLFDERRVDLTVGDVGKDHRVLEAGVDEALAYIAQMRFVPRSIPGTLQYLFGSFGEPQYRFASGLMHRIYREVLADEFGLRRLSKANLGGARADAATNRQYIYDVFEGDHRMRERFVELIWGFFEPIAQLLPYDRSR